MNEGSFKLTGIFVLFFCFCFSNNTNHQSYDFVYVDIIPLNVSKNNLGIRCTKINEEKRLFFQTQNWIAENLYLLGAFSPSINDNINIIYNLNMGYQKKIDESGINNLFFDFGYYCKRLESDPDNNHRWSSISLIFDVDLKNVHFLPSWTYIINNNASNNNSESFITLDFYRNLNDNLILKSGFKLYEEDDIEISPFVCLKYKI